MADLKTKSTRASVNAFLKTGVTADRREDCLTLVRTMQQATGAKPKMWGTSIVGFGSYHFKYASGREGDWFLTGFASRKQALTIYIMAGFGAYEALLARLGKYTTGKGCLYIKRLADVDLAVLQELVTESVQYLKRSPA